MIPSAPSPPGLPPATADRSTRLSILWDILSPAGKAALLSSATVAGTAVPAPDAAAQTNHVQTTIQFDSGTALSPLPSSAEMSEGDLDGDGDLDLVVTGTNTDETTLYENDGTGTFSTVGAGLTPVRNSAHALGDLDGDGDLDLVVTGYDGVAFTEVATVYENTGQNAGSGSLGSTTFQDVSAGIQPVKYSAVGLGDLDGDGDLDLLVTGVTGSTGYGYGTYHALLYENTGQNAGSGSLGGTTFQDLGAPLIQNSQGSAVIADFDGDGDGDLLITGSQAYYAGYYTYYYDANTVLYENQDSDGVAEGADFIEVSTPITDMHRTAAVPADFDGDGDLDLVLAGAYVKTGEGSYDAATTEIYENIDGDGNLDSGDFAQIASPNGARYATAAMGDFDGDGDLDLFVAGRGTYGSNNATVYENEGGGSFSTATYTLSTSVQPSGAIGDFDGDGDLDLVSAGYVHDNTTYATLLIEGTDGADGTDAGWRSLSFPADITLGDIESNFNFDFQNDIGSGSVAYRWDAAAQAWSPLTADADVIAPGEGVLLYLFDDPDDPIESPPNQLSITTPGVSIGTNDVTLSGLATGRFVFIGNPYLAAFDLASLNLNSTDFQQTVQVYNPDTQSFDVLTRGVDDVAGMQGFAIERTSPGSGPTSLTFDATGVQPGNSGSMVGTQSLDPKPQDAAPATADPLAVVSLSLTVDQGGTTVAQDNGRVLFHPDAETGWDAFEASQLVLPQSGSYATLHSPLLRNGTLVRRTQAAEPYPNGDVTVPLSVQSVGTSGTATIALDAAPDGWTLVLEDTVTGEQVDLTTAPHVFTLAAGDGALTSPDEARFRLHATPDAPLPVELTTFTARREGEGALLTWTTASEQGNAGFEVQHLVGDPGSGLYEPLGFVEGAGTTSQTQTYRFRTDRLPVGTHRFRLKQIDTDGSFTYSTTVPLQVTLADRFRLLAPRPNPATDGAHLRLAVEQSQSVRVTVVDLLGREVAVAFDSTLPAQRERAIRVGRGLPAGTYFIRVNGEHFQATERLTVVR